MFTVASSAAAVSDAAVRWCSNTNNYTYDTMTFSSYSTAAAATVAALALFNKWYNLWWWYLLL